MSRGLFASLGERQSALVRVRACVGSPACIKPKRQATDMTGRQAFTRERDPLLVKQHAPCQACQLALSPAPIAYSIIIMRLLLLIELGAEVRQQHLRRRGEHAPPQHCPPTSSIFAILRSPSHVIPVLRIFFPSRYRKASTGSSTALPDVVRRYRTGIA